MPPPRFRHGFPHDVFLSYTHIDDQVDAGSRWVSRFMVDLCTRLEIVSGHTVDVWRDEEKLRAADRFDETIGRAVRDSAVLLTVLSPSYFNSEYCSRERQEFAVHVGSVGQATLGNKSRIVKVAKFFVDLSLYPADLRELLEYRFYEEATHKEFHLSEDPAVRARYYTRVDDVAQEIAALLAMLEPNAEAPSARGAVYVAETTSDLEPNRDDLRRHLRQLGYDVLPQRELRLLPTADLRTFVTETLAQCQIAIHPVGAYYGLVPEGADGKSIVQIQLEISAGLGADGDRARLIWVPEAVAPQEDTQRAFLVRIRTEYAGRGFELLERPFRALATRVEDLLNARLRREDTAESAGIYLVCDNADRATAKTIRSFLFNQKQQIEWTPIAASSDLAGNAEHDKLLRRNRAHLILHGATTDAWIQDRIRELSELRARATGAAPLQAIYLADPQREDKDDILVRDLEVLTGYAPKPIAEVLQPFLAALTSGQRP
jgi:TIR domain